MSSIGRYGHLVRTVLVLVTPALLALATAFAADREPLLALPIAVMAVFAFILVPFVLPPAAFVPERLLEEEANL